MCRELTRARWKVFWGSIGRDLYVRRPPSEIFPFVTHEGDEDEQKDGERPQGRASVADKRKRDADDRHEAHGHADVDEQVHEDAACDTVAIDAGEGLAALLRV